MDAIIEDAPVDLSSHRPTNIAARSALKENNSFGLNKDSRTGRDEAKKLIQKLTRELRNEETNLILLQKLKLSQKQIPLAQKATSNSNSNDQSLVSKPLNSNVSTNLHQSQLKRDNFVSNNPAWSQISINNQTKSVASLSNQNLKPSNGHAKIENAEITKSANRSVTSSQAGQSSSTQSKSNQQQQQQEATARQAATMQMLRKQLERALLQIPPPKPPVPDMPLIPNASSVEFVILLGLEVAVDNISKHDLKSNRNERPETPNSCEQCGTDYTPQWQKTEIEGKMTTLCERCMNNKRKRALKREHTNRLKSAFVKALQQEQEMEKALKTELKQISRSDVSKSKSSNASNGMRRSPQVIDQARQHQQQLLARSQLYSSVASMAAASPSPIPPQFHLADLERLMMLSSKSMLGGLHYPATSIMAAALPQPHRSKDRVPTRAHQQHRASPYNRPN